MEIVYFSKSGANLTKYVEHPEGGIVCDALLFYEGEHPDNKFKKHSCPASRIYEFAANTNMDYNQGRDIPLMVEHSRKLVGKDGSVNKLGKMASAVNCRPIAKEDLANPRLEHLVGKIGAFAQIHILDKIEAVKNKTIRALSAGIDPKNNKFVEISAVADPSLAGASLLFSNPYSVARFSNHGMVDYQEAKAKIQAWEKPHQELQEMFDIFLGTLMAIEQTQSDDLEDFELRNDQLKKNALENFTEDLIDKLGISYEEPESSPEDIYNTNPYQENLFSTNNRQNFSAADTEADILEFATNKKRTKRNRRGA